MALVEVAPGTVDQTRTGRPASAPQDRLLPEGRLRVLLVRIAHESRIGLEGVGDPLPHVADHLTAAEGAVAGGQRPDVDRAPGPVIEVRAVRGRWLIPPRKGPLGAGRRLEGRGHFPLRLGG